MKLTWDFSELNDFVNNLNDFSKFERQMRFATKELAAALLKKMEDLTPIGDTYDLVNGWKGNDFAVKQVENGFEVLLVNTDEKAVWVNDGHRVRNQEGGEYLKVHRRIKVPTAHKWQKPKTDYYVFGHFFVERGILQTSESEQLESIIMKKLEQWWGKV